MVNKFTAFRGLFNGDAWGNAFSEGFNDPTRAQRNKAMTSIAEGNAAFQPMSQALKVGQFGVARQNADTGAFNAETTRGRLGFDIGKQAEDLDFKNRNLEAQGKNILRRSLGSFSPYALADYDSGLTAGAALQRGSSERVKQAGKESGARAGAAASVKQKFAISGGALKRAGEMIQEARAAGVALDPKEAVKNAQAELGETIFTPKGRGVLTDQQRQQQAAYKLVEKTIIGAMQNHMDPISGLTRLLGSEAEAQRMMDLYRKGVSGGGGGATDQSAATGGPSTDTDLDDLLELTRDEYGDDARMWPPEVLNDPQIQAAIERQRR